MGYTQKWGANRESSNDSIAAGKAWQKMKAGYLKKPGGQKEWNMEKNEFYYDTDKNKLRLIPTDDGEIQDESFKSKLKSWQKAPSRETSKIPGQDLDKVQVDEIGEYAVNIHNRQDTIRPADGKNFKPFIKGEQAGKMEDGYLSDDDYTIKDGNIQRVHNMTPNATEEESKAVRDKFDKTYMKGGSSAPTNREVDRESRKHRRYVRVDNRFLDKVEQGKKGTDMDIAKHEKRLKKIAKRKDINPMDEFHLYHGNRGARGYYDNK